MDVIRKDVIVVGLGAFGSAALWRLAERGVSTVGVERYGIGHNLGSSHGLTRLFRIACQEHPGLPAIARKSLELWTGLGEQAGEDLVFQTGCLSAGAPDSRPVKGTLAAAAAAASRYPRSAPETWQRASRSTPDSAQSRWAYGIRAAVSASPSATSVPTSRRHGGAVLRSTPTR